MHEQLFELSNVGRINLANWCFTHNYFTSKRVTPAGYGSFADMHTGEHVMVDEPLLTIGQMIEFLGLVIIQPNISGNEAIYSNLEEIRSWLIIFPTLFKNDTDIKIQCYSLCDGLWEQVKKKLED